MRVSTICLGAFLIAVFPPTDCFQTKINTYLSDYDVLDYVAVTHVHEHTRVRRSFVTHEKSTIPISFNIVAFRRNLTLVLRPDFELINPTARLIVGGQDQPGGLLSVADHAYRGYAVNYPESVVFGSVIRGIFRGTISLEAQSLGSYFVEPAGNFFDHPTPFHSIIYHDSHVKLPESKARVARSTVFPKPIAFCGLSDPIIAQKMRELTSPASGILDEVSKRSRRASVSEPVEVDSNSYAADLSSNDLFNGYRTSNPFAGRISSTSSTAGANTRVCNLYLQSDTFLWDRVISMQHIRGNRDLAVKEITSIFTQHVQGAQAIYQHTLFRDHAGRSDYPGISFRVDYVLINVTEEDCKQRPTLSGLDGVSLSMTPLPPSPTALPHGNRLTNKSMSQLSRSLSHGLLPRGSYADENPFCAENIDVTNYLNLHSYTPHNDFCLAYVFTYRDFSGGTLGLAWVAEPSGSGGVCEKHRLMREGNNNVYKSLNTGVVTLLNYGSQVALKVSQLTFAHEMGHNFGAKHDDDHKDEPYGCLPPIDDPRGNYIMFASATSGDKDNNNKFSLCSSDSIARLLTRILSDDGNCFLSSDGPFCGNQLTEEGEQCDCGFTPNSCRDQCCHPKESASPCKLTNTIFVNETAIKVQCSPTAGECCTHDCQHRGETHLCRAAGECHRSAYCNGVSAKCPPSENLPDGTPCQDHTRVCKQGQCLGSICERISGWHECSLTRDKNVTPEVMCFVSCRENRSSAPCISTFQLEKNSDLQKQYPQLVAELLRDGHGTKLKPGAPCDNYRGYCDVFHRCRSVEAEGPLARLRNLLFSPQMLEKVKAWITVHWWAVILICLCTIIAMVIFVKLFSVSTPRSRHGARPSRPFVAVPAQSPSGGGLMMLPPSPGVLPSLNWSMHSPHGSAPLSAAGGLQPHWAWPRRYCSQGRARRQTKGSRRRQPPLVPMGEIPPSRVIPSAPIDPADFPPPHVRQTPIPFAGHPLVLRKHKRGSDSSGTAEQTPFVPLSFDSGITSTNTQVDHVQPSARLKSKFAEDTHGPFRSRSSDGTSVSNVSNSRPLSLMVYPSTNAPTTSVAQNMPIGRRKAKLPSKIKRSQSPCIDMRPLSASLTTTSEDVVSVVGTQPCNVEQNFQGYMPNSSYGHLPSTSLKVHHTDSSIPPPAYDELPLRRPLKSKQQSSPPRQA
ncbi:disintegrin and metalloproteinase domain-containing protein 10 [Paragonimus westermani]|uniref:ADAM10 endopeptidase n=1 Tax=Paragonimus westermani TaxID=34504 RepID=A0A5J4P1S2_9TREM|nr:disintegrin and metalloproteinase domain-containing protein 10 [Paragonimus westermani]